MIKIIIIIVAHQWLLYHKLYLLHLFFTGYFAVENIELFSPYYDDNSDIEYDYTVVVNVVDSKYSTLSAQNVTINSNNNEIIKDVTLNNNSIAFQMDKRVKGNFGVHLGTNLADYRTSDAYIYDGRVLGYLR